LVNFKVEIVDKDGQIVPILLSATLLYEEDQEVATVGYFKDMREVKRLKQEIHTLFEFEHNLIQSSIDAIIASDRDGCIIVFNQQAEKLLGYSAYEMIMKMSFNELFPPAMLEELRNELASDEYGGENRLLLFETYMINKTGDKIPVQLSATVMFRNQENGTAVYQSGPTASRAQNDFPGQAVRQHCP